MFVNKPNKVKNCHSCFKRMVISEHKTNVLKTVAALFYNIGFICRKKTKHVFFMFYILIKYELLTNQSERMVIYICVRRRKTHYYLALDRGLRREKRNKPPSCFARVVSFSFVNNLLK